MDENMKHELIKRVQILFAHRLYDNGRHDEEITLIIRRLLTEGGMRVYWKRRCCAVGG